MTTHDAGSELDFTDNEADEIMRMSPRVKELALVWLAGFDPELCRRALDRGRKAAPRGGGDIQIVLSFDSDVRAYLVGDLRHASSSLAATLGPHSTRRAFVDEIADQIEAQMPAPTPTDTWDDQEDDDYQEPDHLQDCGGILDAGQACCKTPPP